MIFARLSRAVPSLLALAFLLPGCSKESTGPGGCGDTGGTHLVAFASDRNNTAGQLDIYLYDLDFSGFRLLAGINTTFPERHPALSPDGQFVAFDSDRGAPGGSDIHLYSRCEQKLVDLPAANSDSAETDPAFTGDSFKLVFARQVSGFSRIRMVDGLGDSLVPLPGLDTTAAYSDWDPAPNQDGSLIAFVSDRNGNPDIFVWDKTLRTVRAIAALVSDSMDVEPALTSDGHYLSFASNREGGAGGFDVYLFNLQGGALVPLSLNAETHERNPSLSKDGGRIIFQSNRDLNLGGWDLWIHNRVSGGVTRGTQLSSAGDEIDPSLRWP
jgi:TolB protein